MLVRDVFGIAPVIHADSYVDRGGLDGHVRRLLERHIHLAITGESRSGKSWLRQNTIIDALVVQCRSGHTVLDLYTLALNTLGLRLSFESASAGSMEGRLYSAGSRGEKLLREVLMADLCGFAEEVSSTGIMFHGADHLALIAAVFQASHRRLVIEDFHYLAYAEQRLFASDLKAFWDLSTYVVVIGVWNGPNLLAELNPELHDRQNELVISWTDFELRRVISQGSAMLMLPVAEAIVERILMLSLGNVARLQLLTLQTLEEAEDATASLPHLL
ncbi:MULTISPECIES: hypothetical protein [Subtercola]|uniref:ATP-binding protein n=1 Tax=Subtercola vilae TaxID=2056433 RepID=A0A4T2BU94_9MICO|nr:MULTISPECIES: hypothetical protein [Subtercola]MEA9984654.1 hypothetical protein [Subtercola sp. RTI3]TIH35303.1 hypothetical protein D4765_11360 [Subtercola vilae]